MQWMTVEALRARLAEGAIKRVMVRLTTQELHKVQLTLHASEAIAQLKALPAGDHLTAEVSPDGAQMCIEGW